jgi:PHS family inorganic phosphate transporter-like MFS transporter
MGAICTYFLIPETKNRDADVIDFEEWEDAQSKEKGEKLKA